MAKFPKCGVVFLKENNIHIYDINSNTTKIAISFNFNDNNNFVKDVTISNKTLWVTNSKKIIEYAINYDDDTLPEFIDPKIYDVTQYNISSFGLTGVGLTFNGTHLIMGGSKIWQVNIDTNPVTVSVLFNLPENTTVIGDIFYSPVRNTYIIPYVFEANNLISYFIGEFSTIGEVIKTTQITDKNVKSISGVFGYNSNIYLTTNHHEIFLLDCTKRCRRPDGNSTSKYGCYVPPKCQRHFRTFGG